jgi:hypothetical protein
MARYICFNNIEATFSALSVLRGYKEKKRRSFQSVEFRDDSLPGYELGCRGIEASELWSEIQWSRKIGYEEKTLCVL